MSSHLVSTLVPVFNAMAFLPEMIASLQAQTYANHEIILVDDCSTDGSFAYLSEIATADPRFKVYRNTKNAGPSASINRAAKLAGGDLLARLDADDVAMPQRIERQVDYLQKHPSVGYVGSDFWRISESGKRMGKVKATVRGGDGLKAMFLFQNTVCHSTVMYRREVFDRIGGYNEDLRASLDYDLLARLSTQGEGYILPEMLLAYRTHESNISSTSTPLQRQNAAGVQQRLLDHYGFTYSEQELELHHQATIFKAIPDYVITPLALKDIRAWLRTFQQQNQQLNCFSDPALRTVLRKVHNGVFARKNSQLRFRDYVGQFTTEFGALHPNSMFLQILHSLKNGL